MWVIAWVSSKRNSNNASFSSYVDGSRSWFSFRITCQFETSTNKNAMQLQWINQFKSRTEVVQLVWHTCNERVIHLTNVFASPSHSIIPSIDVILRSKSKRLNLHCHKTLSLPIWLNECSFSMWHINENIIVKSNCKFCVCVFFFSCSSNWQTI